TETTRPSVEISGTTTGGLARNIIDSPIADPSERASVAGVPNGDEQTGATTMIRVGIGGWTFEPWRNNFYPPGLAQKRELEYASSKMTSIEVNGTYYGSQKPESFRKWADETPDDFVFALKGPRFATNRRVLGEAGESIGRFFDSGITE